MLVVSLRGVNFRFWSRLGSPIFLALKVLLRVAREKLQHFFKKNSPRLVSIRGQKMYEPLPDWSPLGVNLKILDEYPHLFLYSSPPPPGIDDVV